ncbi:MAG TPA: adenylate/guanylate cyclase domain-containing protein [Acidimicrobiales bacterium]|nr:adenylate/guanylate cyclase domain-containing protein [Acidimicrobiales bacterium]
MSDELPSVRIDDVERERAVAFLRHHLGDGRITLDEFSDRVGHVYAAVTNNDIEVVTRDLPVVVPRTTGMPAPAAASGSRLRRVVNVTVSIFSSSQRKGRWRVEGSTTAVSIMGSCQLDLRQAEVVGDEVTIHAFAVMGGVDIIVPEGIEVVMQGLPIMGSNQTAIRDVPVIPGSPLVRVRAFALMGGVTVRSRKPPGETKKLSHEQRRLERDARRADRHDRDRDRDRGRDRDRDGPPTRGLDRQPPPQLRRGIEAVAEDVRDEWTQLRSQVAPEGTVTILFSDIEGFTSLNERLGDMQAREVLREHYRLVRAELLTHRGFEVKVHGDGFMVAFDSAARALRCAQAIQKKQWAWTAAHPDTPLRVRMGLHTGEAIRDADDFLGSTVNLASRIATAARGEEILVSALLKELCASSGEFEFDRGQEIDLKGLSQPHRVFAVTWA